MKRIDWLGAILWLIMVSGVTLASAQIPEASVSIAFVGDIMLAETPGKVVRSGRDPFAPFAATLNAADIRVGNLECVVATKGTPQPDKPFTFRANPRTLRVLKRHFDAVGLANNHSGDYGPIAFAEMLDLLDGNGIGYFGGGRNLHQAHQPLIIERNGLRVALLGYDEFMPRSFEADVDKPGIAWSEDEQVRLDIGRARTVFQADLVIPVMHWGWEDEPNASDRQRQLARTMIDAGADAVVGGHPHVTQNVEQYRGKPIIYSLGNFLFNGFTEQANITGWLLRLELDREGARSWRTVTAHIDHEGIPHPAMIGDELCWNRGEEKARDCAAAPN
ncbi:CapA family protein [Glaciimonas sp. CA11.2]|nr:CapA family protein [Glaciimonas sp. CA11.2]MDY7547678.1 CapA family protein [Glaciimonas sp. CA11.2]MEB0161405.1 CapA family protein [Glaciimonas sp. CA11.2]